MTIDTKNTIVGIGAMLAILLFCGSIIYTIANKSPYNPTLQISCVTHTNDLYIRKPIAVEPISINLLWPATVFSRYAPHIRRTNDLWMVEFKD